MKTVTIDGREFVELWGAPWTLASGNPAVSVEYDRDAASLFWKCMPDNCKCTGAVVRILVPRECFAAPDAEAVVEVVNA